MYQSAFSVVVLWNPRKLDKLTFWCNVWRKKLYSNFMQKHPQLKSKQVHKSKKYKSNFWRFELFWTLNEKKSLFETKFLSVIITSFKNDSGRQFTFIWKPSQWRKQLSGLWIITFLNSKWYWFSKPTHCYFYPLICSVISGKHLR